jgi:hypothetical protein
MALRRNKFSTGDYVLVGSEAHRPLRIITVIVVEHEDTFQYMIDGLGWRLEKELTLYKSHLQALSEKQARTNQ